MSRSPKALGLSAVKVEPLKIPMFLLNLGAVFLTSQRRERFMEKLKAPTPPFSPP